MLVTITCSLCAAFLGFMCCAILIPKPSEEAPDKPIELETKKLKRHDLHINIPRDRVLNDPQETIMRIKKEFVWQIMDSIQDSIVMEEDHRRGFFSYTVSIWTIDEGGSR